MADQTLKARIDSALKEALLSRNELKATVLRGLKAAILNEEVAQGARETGLADDAIQSILVKEAKKRQESADMFTQGNAPDKAAKELEEKAMIETFLPAKMSDDELSALVDQTVADNPDAQMGQVIGLIKQAAGASADGAKIAQLVKAALQS